MISDILESYEILSYIYVKTILVESYRSNHELYICTYVKVSLLSELGFNMCTSQTNIKNMIVDERDSFY